MQGFMNRRGEKIKTWKRRFFNIVDEDLVYYTGANFDETLGTIHLPDSQLIPFDFQAHIFGLQEKNADKVVMLQCANAQDFQQWMDALQAVVWRVLQKLKSGYLLKTGSGGYSGGGWKRRWVVLFDCALHYYDKQVDSRPSGVVELTTESWVRQGVGEEPSGPPVLQRKPSSKRRTSRKGGLNIKHITHAARDKTLKAPALDQIFCVSASKDARVFTFAASNQREHRNWMQSLRGCMRVIRLAAKHTRNASLRGPPSSPPTPPSSDSEDDAPPPPPPDLLTPPRAGPPPSARDSDSDNAPPPPPEHAKGIVKYTQLPPSATADNNGAEVGRERQLTRLQTEIAKRKAKQGIRGQGTSNSMSPSSRVNSDSEDEFDSGRLSFVDPQARHASLGKSLCRGTLTVQTGRTTWRTAYYCIGQGAKFLFGYEKKEKMHQHDLKSTIPTDDAILVDYGVDVFPRIRNAFHFGLRSRGTDEVVVFEATSQKSKAKWLKNLQRVGCRPPSTVVAKTLTTEGRDIPPVREGYLLKMGAIEKVSGPRGGWRPRYFVLDVNPGRLDYHKTFEDANAEMVRSAGKVTRLRARSVFSHTIVLDVNTVVSVLRGELLGQHSVVSIQPPGGRRYLLSARSPEDAAAWCSDIQQVAKQRALYRARASEPQQLSASPASEVQIAALKQQLQEARHSGELHVASEGVVSAMTKQLQAAREESSAFRLELEALEAQRVAEVDDSQQSLAEATRKIEQLVASLDKAEKARQVAEKERNDIAHGEEIKLRDEARKELETLSSKADELAAEIEAAEQLLDETQGELAESTEMFEDITQQRELVEAELSEMLDMKADMEDAELRMLRQREVCAEWETELQSKEEEMQEILDREADLDARERSLKALEEELRIKEQSVRQFSEIMNSGV